MRVHVGHAHLRTAVFAVERNNMFKRSHIRFSMGDIIQYIIHTHILFEETAQEGQGEWRVGEGEQNTGLSQTVS